MGWELRQQLKARYIWKYDEIKINENMMKLPILVKLYLCANELACSAILIFLFCFQQLYRKKLGMTMNASRLSENIVRNRYRDIAPYDQTRVKIDGETGEYINANFVNVSTWNLKLLPATVEIYKQLPIGQSYWISVKFLHPLFWTLSKMTSLSLQCNCKWRVSSVGPNFKCKRRQY